MGAISELPDAWRRGVGRWMRSMPRHERWSTATRPRIAPTSTSSTRRWSASGRPRARRRDARSSAPAALVERLVGYMQKAIKEAKVHTSWVSQDAAYETAVRQFVQRTLTGRTAPALPRLVPAVRASDRPAGAVQLAVAAGAQGDLARRRRPVSGHRALGPHAGRSRQPPAGRLRPAPGRCSARSNRCCTRAMPRARAAGVRALLRHVAGRPRQAAVTAALLRARRDAAQVFLEGSYTAGLGVDEIAQRHLVAFARRLGNDVRLTVAPRLTGSLLTETPRLPVGRESGRTPASSCRRRLGPIASSTSSPANGLRSRRSMAAASWSRPTCWRRHRSRCCAPHGVARQTTRSGERLSMSGVDGQTRPSPARVATRWAPRWSGRRGQLPRLGAHHDGDVRVVDRRHVARAVTREADGYFQGEFAGARRAAATGSARSRHTPLPDPASRSAARRAARLVGGGRLRRPSSGPTTTGAVSTLRGQVIYELHVGTFTAEGTWQAAAAASAALAGARRHGGADDAGRRVPGRVRLGLRRRRLVRADTPLRHTRRPAPLRRRRPRPRARRHPRRGLQPPRPERQLPGRFAHDYFTDRASPTSGAGASISTASAPTGMRELVLATSDTGFASSTSTASDSTRRTPSSTTRPSTCSPHSGGARARPPRRARDHRRRERAAAPDG